MTSRADYGGRVPAVAGGGVVSRVLPGSPADRGGVRSGDLIVSVEGEPLRDVIDWLWLTDGDAIELSVRAKGTSADSLRLTRAPGEPWGVDFDAAVFDGVRTCRNRCAFCFMAQLPKGLRRALYLRDDDYRLSFLQGNFVTATNLSDDDVERIIEQHLSPLYVSLHAVTPDIRAELICAREDRALDRFDELVEGGIDMHVQIVLVPGVNDGDELEHTLRWLAEREGVRSVGIVPLGYTAHQASFPGSFEEPAAARAVIVQVSPWQRAFRQRDGIGWVYLADEFYLNARIPVPPAEEYDGFPQYENGIGLVRDWLDGVEALRGDLAAAVAGLDRPVALVTGALFAPVLSETVASLGPKEGFVLVVAPANRFFGGNVSVTGLLCGEDLVPAIAATREGTVAIVPDVVANADGLLLDDMPVAELGPRTGREVRLVSCSAAGLLGGLREAAAGPHESKE